MRLSELKAVGNRNVRVSLVYTALYSVAAGIWGTVCLSGYLQGMPGDPGQKNFRVGLAEGLQGTVQAVAALPSGVMADKFGREMMLKFACFVGLVAVGCCIVTLHMGAKLDKDKDSDGTSEFILMCFSLCLFGLFDGSSSGASEAIFHDSIETSERTSVTTLKFVTRVFFRAAGPVISVVLFYALGDAWTRGELRTVFYVGVSLSAIPALLLLCFRDSSTLGAESDAVRLEDPDACFDITQSPYVALADDAGDLEVEEDPLVLEQLGNSSFEVAKYRIPRIVLMSDVFFGLASGMTIKFFPLFFKEEVQMSPASVNWIYVVSPMCVVSLSILANRLTATFGRVRVPLVFSSSGICLLLLMWYMGHELWQNKAAIVPIFIARTALMNCCSPIRKSILIDFVNKEARARWSSMDSVTQFSWSGSAVLGGLLVDKYGYGSSFLATALVQIAALSTFGSLLYYRQIIDGVHRTGVN